MRLVRKESQRKASHKGTDTSAITKPLQLLHMDLFGPGDYDVYVKEMACSCDCR